MQLRARTWFRFCLYGQFAVVPLLVPLVLGFIGVIHVGWCIASFAVLGCFGTSGAIVGILIATGAIQVVFTKRDVDSWILGFWYRMESWRGAPILEDDEPDQQTQQPARRSIFGCNK